jgi:hypothetical protein
VKSALVGGRQDKRGHAKKHAEEKGEELLALFVGRAGGLRIP